MIDAHCHIDLYQNPRGILEFCEINRVTVLAMTNLPSHFELGLPHVRNYKRVRLSLGMHPLYASSFDDEFDRFLSNLHRTSYIGEIGLDFSREGYRTKDLQLFFFRKILESISNQPKILSIHSRRAEKRVLEELVFHKVRLAVFHWYSGPLSLIEEICERGYYFSINPAMIISDTGRKIIANISQTKILTESDGPFIQVDNRQVLPSDTKLVIEFLSAQWGISFLEANKIVSSNFKTLISML
ncbi:TatD family deoxyribonuclease [Pedobacter frigidisoli]|uniref:TatD family deoxyribonuclease n=1 Tax=Pedobacter frigidisoli TaxID=2530455 RepID=A0A4R0P3A6_9SPHI|nr:TatD family hydrolase [Pedobacter frigidisoli]TCD08597.1 TatD family deoxyribonuclease [Pedobacter frigidisoli]